MYPHLIESTISDYDKRTYVMGIGVQYDDLTDEEKKVLSESREYEKEYVSTENAKLLKEAREAFERLRDIPGLPQEAVDILKEWTFRDEDYL